MAIDYVEKGCGLHKAIRASGHWLIQQDGEWRSSDDERVQKIIDEYTAAPPAPVVPPSDQAMSSAATAAGSGARPVDSSAAADVWREEPPWWKKTDWVVAVLITGVLIAGLHLAFPTAFKRALNHQGLASWIQAFGSVGAIFVAVWVMRSEKRIDRMRDTQRADHHNLLQLQLAIDAAKSVYLVAQQASMIYGGTPDVHLNLPPRTIRRHADRMWHAIEGFQARSDAMDLAEQCHWLVDDFAETLERHMELQTQRSTLHGAMKTQQRLEAVRANKERADEIKRLRQRAARAHEQLGMAFTRMTMHMVQLQVAFKRFYKEEPTRLG